MVATDFDGSVDIVGFCGGVFKRSSNLLIELFVSTEGSLATTVLLTTCFEVSVGCFGGVFNVSGRV